jgi:sRNA-binding protein
LRKPLALPIARRRQEYKEKKKKKKKKRGEKKETQGSPAKAPSCPRKKKQKDSNLRPSNAARRKCTVTMKISAIPR